MNCNPPLFLVIEDHPEVSQNNCEFLRMLEPQCNCVSVDTPEKGAEQLELKIPNLLVVDLQFGTVGGEQSAKPGLELLKQIFDRYPTVNILVYSSEPSCLRQSALLLFGILSLKSLSHCAARKVVCQFMNFTLMMPTQQLLLQLLGIKNFNSFAEEFLKG